MHKGMRITATVLAFTVFFVMLFSFAFIVLESEHDCDGENCPICFQISVCADVVKCIGTAVIVFVAVVFGRLCAFSLSRLLNIETKHIVSLVTLRTKLSN